MRGGKAFSMAMAESRLAALGEVELRAEYEAVLGKPAPRGPAITRAVLVNAIMKAAGRCVLLDAAPICDCVWSRDFS